MAKCSRAEQSLLSTHRAQVLLPAPGLQLRQSAGPRTGAMSVSAAPLLRGGADHLSTTATARMTVAPPLPHTHLATPPLVALSTTRPAATKRGIDMTIGTGALLVDPLTTRPLETVVATPLLPGTAGGTDKALTHLTRVVLRPDSWFNN